MATKEINHQTINFLLLFVFLQNSAFCNSATLSTNSRWIVHEASGKRVKLACVNWPSGFSYAANDRRGPREEAIKLHSKTDSCIRVQLREVHQARSNYWYTLTEAHRCKFIQPKLKTHPITFFFTNTSAFGALLVAANSRCMAMLLKLRQKKLLQVKAHTKTCHALRFVNEGRAILTGSSDCSILSIDVETGSKIARLDHAHGDTINKIVNLTESTIASGDNGGCIKIWDTRQRSCCNTFNVHQDYISDMSFASESMKLIGTSGDGTLSVCNLRSNKVQTQSEFSEDELLSVVIMKNGRKVICGTQSGTLLLYSWGFFKDCSDRFVGLSPNPVNTMLKLDEDRIITGSENGIISLIGILPNRIIQPIAEHHSIHSVERLAFSHDKKFIGSISEEETLKIWNLDELLQGSENSMSNNSVASDSDRDGMEVDENVPIPSKGTKTKNESRRSNLSNASNFFADM